jgi:hypothetical protein
MQLLFSSTIPIVEFASMSLLLENSAEVGESIITASPLSTTPFSSEALTELHEYLNSIHQDAIGNRANEKGDSMLSCIEQLATDDMQPTSPRIYRSEHCGLGLYFWVVKEPGFVQRAFPVLMASKARFETKQVFGIVLCVGVAGLFSAQPSSLLVQSLPSRIQDVVHVMMRMGGDAEECRACYRALLSTLLITEDEERKTNGMMESAQVTVELDQEFGEKEQAATKFSIKSKRGFGLKRGVSTDTMNATFVSNSSADKARLMEKISAVLSVAEKDCKLRRYESRRNLDESTTSGSKSRRRKTKVDESLRDFDYPLAPQQRIAVPEAAAAVARSRQEAASASMKSPGIQKPQKDIPSRSPVVRSSSKLSILAPPRSNPTSFRRSSLASPTLNASGSSLQAQERQAAFNAFDIASDSDASVKGSLIAFPGLDGSSNGLFDQQSPANRAHSIGNSFSDSSPTDSRAETGRMDSFGPFLGDETSTASKAATSSSLEISARNNIDDSDDHKQNGSDPPGLAAEDDSSHGQIVGTSKSSHHIQVNIALNEDLTCSYKQGRISSCTIEGVVQVQVRSDANDVAPFFLLIRDQSHHVRMIQENRRYADDMTEHISKANEEEADIDYKFTVSVPKAENYFPVMRYKCSPELRPVPIRVQTRVRVSQNSCRVALQISSNPANEDDLTDLTIIMGVPIEIKGETLSTSPSGGVWNAAKRSVIWCVAELGDGEKFQLQAQFEIEPDKLEELEQEKPKFPVLVRCQCMYAQLSDIDLQVSNIPDAFPTEVTMKLARRFRLSHRERS